MQDAALFFPDPARTKLSTTAKVLIACSTCDFEEALFANRDVNAETRLLLNRRKTPVDIRSVVVVRETVVSAGPFSAQEQKGRDRYANARARRCVGYRFLHIIIIIIVYILSSTAGL